MSKQPMLNPKSAYLCFSLAALCSLGMAVRLCAQSGPSPLEALESRKSVIETIEATGTEISIYNRSPELLSGVVEGIHRDFLKSPATLTQTTWMARGVQQRAEVRVLLPKEAPFDSHIVSATDGKVLQIWEWDDPSADQSVAQPDTEVFQSLSTWLQVAPHAAAPVVLFDPLLAAHPQPIKSEKLGDVDTLRYELPVGDEIQTWWVAPKYGSVVVRYERRNVQPVENNSTVSWRHVRVVDRLDLISEIWMPRQVRHFNFVTLRNGKTYWENWIRADISEMKVNQPLAVSPFRLALPLQTAILSEKDEKSVVGGDISDGYVTLASMVEKRELPARELSEVPLTRQLILTPKKNNPT